ncbi:MAG TPA: Zn-dependent hydrolase [Thermomicrobiaceae bacterium]|nr:Zn-dependent hydrolase [Thermomicrobiaceae bacterium]
MPLRINADRLHARLEAMARVGATPAGGVGRTTLSDEDRAGRDLLRSWLEAAGLAVRVDDFGNMTARRPGREDGPPVQLGSHLDSVPRGGRFDGALGVLAALEVVETLNDTNVTTRLPLEVINFTDEEGARFEPAMLGSGAAIGHFPKDYVYARTDARGLRFADELRRIGYQGREADRPRPGAAYLELHIEQGPALEAAGLPVGVVAGIVGITWLEVTVVGQSDHAGPTPMGLRHDALVAAARVIDRIDRLVRQVDERAVATVGRLRIEPDVINIIPGRAVFSVDLRHPDLATLDALVTHLEAIVGSETVASGLEATIDRFWTSEPTPFSPAVVDAVAAAADELELPTMRLWSGAGHDAKYMAEVCPTAMIFVRSQGGVSHCEQEYSTPEDVEAGANVLLGAALRLAGTTEGVDG